MSTALQVLTSNLAERFGMSSGNSKELMDTLKATAFKVKDGVVGDHQMTALMIVAQQYGLNPWTKEIYAYPDKQNGIVPVVGVDGWSRIINDNPILDGIEFRYSNETFEHKGKKAHDWIECIITRKDRTKPIVVREYFDEVCRTVNFPTPWDTHPKRMHRHKALIQCARVAFGFGGIYDQDEVEGIVAEKEINPMQPSHELSALEKTLAEIKTMTAEELKGFTGAGLTESEKATARTAWIARSKELRESAVVADIKPEPASELSWPERISACKTDEELDALLKEMPEAVQLDLGDEINMQYDSFR